jgi:pimeloyl-ACP methyl ester carboxylesterase
MGYSMGARIALAACLESPARVATLTLGGVGARLLEPNTIPGNPMAAAMEADDPESISEPMLRSFRGFADEQGEDRLALAALTRAPDAPFEQAGLRALEVPVLVVAGARDELAGDPEILAKAFGDGRAVALPGCDHFSAIAHGLYKATVFDFLDGTLP